MNDHKGRIAPPTPAAFLNGLAAACQGGTAKLPPILFALLPAMGLGPYPQRPARRAFGRCGLSCAPGQRPIATNSPSRPIASHAERARALIRGTPRTDDGLPRRQRHRCGKDPDRIPENHRPLIIPHRNASASNGRPAGRTHDRPTECSAADPRHYRQYEQQPGKRAPKPDPAHVDAQQRGHEGKERNYDRSKRDMEPALRRQISFGNKMRIRNKYARAGKSEADYCK